MHKRISYPNYMLLELKMIVIVRPIEKYIVTIEDFYLCWIVCLGQASMLIPALH